MENPWDQIQDKVSSCRLCEKQFPLIPVNYPPGKIYPTYEEIPKRIKVLFIGVAPPQKGRHFYSDSHDKLRSGLFGVLASLGYFCSNIEEFHRLGFFLIHCAKCAIKETTKPSKQVSLFCTQQHLKREIEGLMPDAVCWLSKNVGWKVCQELLTHWVVLQRFDFGEVGTVRIKSKSVSMLSTMWPGRSWEHQTKEHIYRLLTDLKES